MAASNSSEDVINIEENSNSEQQIISKCTEETINLCEHCCLLSKSKYQITYGNQTVFVCGAICLNNYKSTLGDNVLHLEEEQEPNQHSTGCFSIPVPENPFSRKCGNCRKLIVDQDLSVLSWETLEFCNNDCLAIYQKSIGSMCSKCQVAVPENCMAKYCVRFGYNIRQFCSSACLEEYKKGLKVCSYCQKEMCEEGFLAPVTEKSVFKDFCSKECVEKYNNLIKTIGSKTIAGECSVCHKDKSTFSFDYNDRENLFCGEACFVAFKFVNNIAAGKCDMCQNYFENEMLADCIMYHDDVLRTFCSKGCQNVYIIANRIIVPCCWCKVKKYNFDMIKRQIDFNSAILGCSLNCLQNQVLSYNKDLSNWSECDQCHQTKQPLYYLKMSDCTLRSFCSYACVLSFQNGFPKMLPNEPIPQGEPKRYTPQIVQQENPTTPTIPIITNVQSLADVGGSAHLHINRNCTTENGVLTDSSPVQVKKQIKQQIIIKPPPPVLQRNVSTMCKVTVYSKETSTCATTVDKDIQTDETKSNTIFVPVPVPVYIPLPMRMYSQPFPVPFPFPLPIPVPIFIPTTRNSAKGIMKEIKKIEAKMPSNPLEAELLMIADMVAGDQKEVPTDSETEGEEPPDLAEERADSPELSNPNNSFASREEELQMSINTSGNLNEPVVDLEGALAVNTVTASVKPEETTSLVDIRERISTTERRPSRGRGGRGSRGKRQSRRSMSHLDVSILNADQPLVPSEPLEKPDANMCLKYTFGVNAWKQWVSTKNTELEQTSSRPKLFKPEILQLTADELNYSLCLFVKEVRKPNGQEYAPDTIYYLCLGVQQYLYENGRIDNIFCDSYYEKFTDCLDEVAKKFSVLYNDSHYIITRVEEEHLWESKQLGAHSPHVLLSTLMFFNTKHFNLTSVDDHMQLSFSHIMKHWKRNPTHSGAQKSSGSRNVLLRFYPPQTVSDGSTTRKKKVYEQQENEENPLRCPVKLYEFYLSKCPESVKTRNDVFYLQPERSCVPDSPVWYSTSALAQESLEKMLHRVKMVKEINVALLTS